jgi:hypothetical protein
LLQQKQQRHAAQQHLFAVAESLINDHAIVTLPANSERDVLNQALVMPLVQRFERRPKVRLQVEKTTERLCSIGGASDAAGNGTQNLRQFSFGKVGGQFLGYVLAFQSRQRHHQLPAVARLLNARIRQGHQAKQLCLPLFAESVGGGTAGR